MLQDPDSITYTFFSVSAILISFRKCYRNIKASYDDGNNTLQMENLTGGRGRGGGSLKVDLGHLVWIAQGKGSRLFKPCFVND